MTVADTNVRPAWRSPAANARETRRFGLARLLLKELGRLLRKLDLTFLLLLAVVPTPACVIPVGPEWQDPVGAPNAQPRILNPVPYWGADVFAYPSMPQHFVFFVTDDNVGQRLEIWGFVDGHRLIDDSAVAGVPHRVEKTVVCLDLDPSLDRHKIIVGVTDSVFLDTNDPDDLLRTKNNDEPAIITWQLTMTCQPP